MDEYYTDDITWCSNMNCNNKKCERNPKRIRRQPSKMYFFADLDGTVYCEKKHEHKKKEGENDGQRKADRLL